MTRDTCFGQIYSKNLKLLVQNKNLIISLIRIWRIQWWCSFFLFSLSSILVWENCFKKSKLFFKAKLWNLEWSEFVEFGGEFQICKIWWWCSQVSSKKSIWHFGVTWFISQKFTHRELMPVAFLVSIKRWKISSQPSDPRCGRPGYQP